MQNHRRTLISLIISGVVSSPVYVQAKTVIDNDVISVQDTWGILNITDQYEIKNTQINVTVVGNTSQTNGIIVNALVDESLNTTTTFVQDSVINSQGNGAYLVGGFTQFDNTKILAMGNYGVVTKGGNIVIENGSVIDAKNDAYGFYLTPGYDGSGYHGTYIENNVTLDNASVTTETGTAVVVGTGTTAHLDINNHSTITAGTNKLLVAMDDSDVDINLNGSTATGSLAALDNAVVNVGLSNASSLAGAAQNINSLNIDSTSSWDVISSSDVNSVNNSGVITLSDGVNIGSTLTIHNDYKGKDGTIIFNSQLAGDDSVTDKLIIEGKSEGNTKVVVNNIGGKGAQTIEGIELIHVDGQSDGTFVQSGRIVSGAYDYSLIRGDKNSNNWYLTSQLPVQPPVEPPVQPPVEPPVQPPVEPPVLPPVEPPVNHEHVNRPEGGAYSANIAAAMTLFENRLSDRQGTFYIDPVTGEQNYTSLWLHQVGGHTRAKDTSGQLKTTNNRYAVMLGGDIGSGTGEAGSWRIGVLAGYGNSHSNTTSNITGYHAKGDIKGYTSGLYGTWYADGSDQQGLYVDTVIQYSWFDNTVKGDGVSSERYNAKGLSASVETGYILPITQNLFIQPQAQITWSDISADNHTEKNGTRVTDNTDDNIRTRLGIKAFAQGHSSLDDNSGRSFKPFLETNWIHNSQNYGVSMDGVNITQSGTRNIAEAKVGLEGNLSSQLRLTGNVGLQVGDNGWSDTSAVLGVRYSF